MLRTSRDEVNYTLHSGCRNILVFLLSRGLLCLILMRLQGETTLHFKAYIGNWHWFCFGCTTDSFSTFDTWLILSRAQSLRLWSGDYCAFVLFQYKAFGDYCLESIADIIGDFLMYWLIMHLVI